jgi:hypothetical protein
MAVLMKAQEEGDVLKGCCTTLWSRAAPALMQLASATELLQLGEESTEESIESATEDAVTDNQAGTAADACLPANLMDTLAARLEDAAPSVLKAAQACMNSRAGLKSQLQALQHKRERLHGQVEVCLQRELIRFVAYLCLTQPVRPGPRKEETGQGCVARKAIMQKASLST